MTQANIVVFDIDGTLTDSVSAHQSAFEAALHSFNFPALRTDWGSYKHHSDSAILSEAWAEAGREGAADLARLEAEYARVYDNAVKKIPFSEIPGARHFVSLLREEGWTLVFATGSLRHGALHKLSVVGIDGEAEILVTASELQTREEIVGRAVEHAYEAIDQKRPARVVSIGDGIWDLKTARNLGYEFIGIGSSGNAEALKTMGAVVYNDFEALLVEGLSTLKLFEKPLPRLGPVQRVQL